MIGPEAPFADGAFRLWRLDRRPHANGWASGEGSRIAGGRWNSKGRAVVYMALDAATAILEVAVHAGFRTLDIVEHVLTCATLRGDGDVHVVFPEDVPNANWLVPGVPSAGQQAFGDRLVRDHGCVLVPSVVSRHSWNALLDPEHLPIVTVGAAQEPFALDPRLHPGT